MIDQKSEDTPPWVRDRILPPDKEQLFRSRLEQHHLNVDDDLQYRPYWFRHRYVPWLASVVRLDGARVLEVGCGTGASTIQIAERGARVTAVDYAPEALELTRFRAELHGVADRVETHFANAAEIGKLFTGPFDVVAYTAALEHMTHEERQATLAAAWRMLPSGAALVIVDSPNRLWFHDDHTTMARFYHWLPDDLAIDYAVHSTRADFAGIFKGAPREHARVLLARWGRGVSFHDFHLAIGPLEQLRVAGEWDYRRAKEPAWAKNWAAMLEGRYQSLLREMMPTLPQPWFEPELALVIGKP